MFPDQKKVERVVFGSVQVVGCPENGFGLMTLGTCIAICSAAFVISGMLDSLLDAERFFFERP